MFSLSNKPSYLSLSSVSVTVAPEQSVSPVSWEMRSGPVIKMHELSLSVRHVKTDRQSTTLEHTSVTHSSSPLAGPTECVSCSTISISPSGLWITRPWQPGAFPPPPVTYWGIVNYGIAYTPTYTLSLWPNRRLLIEVHVDSWSGKWGQCWIARNPHSVMTTRGRLHRLQSVWKWS